MSSTMTCHLLQVVGRSQRRVTRSTFTSELVAACDTADMGILIAHSIHELMSGKASVSESRDRRERGGYATRLTLYLDALSVHVAVTSTVVRHPQTSARYVMCSISESYLTIKFFSHYSGAKLEIC